MEKSKIRLIVNCTFAEKPDEAETVKEPPTGVNDVDLTLSPNSKSALDQKKILFNFMEATQGNWRNSLYIEGDSTTLFNESGKDYLLAFGCSGLPIFIQAEHITPLAYFTIDKDECISVIKAEKAKELFHMWLIWHS